MVLCGTSVISASSAAVTSTVPQVPQPLSGPFTIARRIVRQLMEPLSLVEAGAIYSNARKELRRPKQRGLSERHAELAAFAAEINDGRSWELAMHEWNRRHRKWKAARVSTFTRDARAAFKRVMLRDLAWLGKRGRPRSRQPG